MMDNQEKEKKEEGLELLIKQINQYEKLLIFYRMFLIFSLICFVVTAIGVANYIESKINDVALEEVNPTNNDQLLSDLTDYLMDNHWAIDRFKIDNNSIYYLAQNNGAYYLYNVALNDASKNELKFGEPVSQFILSNDFVYVQTEFNWGDIEYSEERLNKEEIINYNDPSIKQINKIYQINKSNGEIIDLSQSIKIQSKESFSPYFYLELLTEYDNKLYFLTGNSYQNYGAYTNLCSLDLKSNEMKFSTSEIPFETASKSFFKEGQLFVQESIESDFINLYSFDLSSGSFQLQEQNLDVSEEINKDILEFVSHLK